MPPVRRSRRSAASPIRTLGNGDEEEVVGGGKERRRERRRGSSEGHTDGETDNDDASKSLTIHAESLINIQQPHPPLFLLPLTKPGRTATRAATATATRNANCSIRQVIHRKADLLDYSMQL
jgi:hypothetical protein